MAVRIRLRRIGKRKQPEYRLVVANSAAPRDGRFIEVIGHYAPRSNPPAVTVNEERVRYWLERGAQPSDTARSLLATAGGWEKFSGERAPQGAALRRGAGPAPAEAEGAREAEQAQEAGDEGGVV